VALPIRPTDDVTIEQCMELYGKYENKDPRCTYPFEPLPTGYCWGYAVSVDYGVPMTAEKCKKSKCDCWEEKGDSNGTT
jgi:hypothetical protein